MKPFWIASALLASCLPAAQAVRSDALQLLSTLPPCALTCLITAVSTSTCAPTDNACVCANAELQADVSGCVMQKCTLRQGLFTKNVTETVCEAPVRNKEPIIHRWDIALGVISGTIVGIRFGFKFWAGLGITADDLWIAITLFLGFPSTAIIIHGAGANGLGKDIWTVPFDSITSFGYYFYVLEILYFVQITGLKMSLMFFYLRIFPTKVVRNLIWGTIAFNSLYCITFIFAGTFQCQPVSFYWTKWDGTQQGTCLNSNAIVWSNAAISIALDGWMLLIPLWQLHSLNLQWKKKLGVGLMFCVGTFVTVVSILRLQSLVHVATSQNPTWDQFDSALWSLIEVHTGVICTCMPTLRLILVRIFPALGGTSRRGYYNHTGDKGASTIGKKSRSADISSASSPTSHLGDIVYQKSYSVRFDDHGSDEASLVHMHDLSTPKQVHHNTSVAAV